MNRIEIIRQLDTVHANIQAHKRIIGDAVKERAEIMDKYFIQIEMLNTSIADLENRRKHFLAMADKLNGVKV